MGWSVRRFGPLLTALVLLDACVAPRQAPPPAPAPAPSPTPTPLPPPPPADWRDRAYTPGDWTYARESGVSVARYGTALEMRCQSGTVTLAVAGASGPLIVRTSYGDTARQANAAGLRLLSTDPLLDQIAYTRGRFMVSAGTTELILPAWPEVQRVVEDCR